MRKLRFLRPWRSYRTGQVVDVPGGIAAQLLAQRLAVEDTQGSLIETAAIEQRVETANATTRKRGRPRAVPQPGTPDATSR